MPALALDVDLKQADKELAAEMGSRVGYGLVWDLIACLDTHVVLWLCEDRLDRISEPALDALNRHEPLIADCQR